MYPHNECGGINDRISIPSPHSILQNGVYLVLHMVAEFLLQIIKNEDLQNLILSKRDNADEPGKIFPAMNSTICLFTIAPWCQMTFESGVIGR